MGQSPAFGVRSVNIFSRQSCQNARMLKLNGITLLGEDDDGDGGRQYRLGGGRFNLPSWIFYPFVALLSLWVFGYVSGLFPYTGYKAGGYVTWRGPVGSTSYGIGNNDEIQTHYLFLFAGQTAIVDYDVTVRKGKLDIEIVQGVLLGPKLVEHSIDQSSKGRVSVKVPTTSIYTIYFQPRYRIDTPKAETDINYSLWWGGLFGA